MANTININGVEYVAVVPEAPVAPEAPAAPVNSAIGTSLKDCILARLAAEGSSEVGSLEVTLNSGETFLIASENHPALSRPAQASDIRSIVKKQTVEAGK